MNQRRIAEHRFTRLPNVVPVASIGEHEDLSTLIRHIVRKEFQRMLAPAQQNPHPSTKTYATAVLQTRRHVEPLPRQSVVWRTDDKTDLFAFIVGDRTTWFVTDVNDEVFLTHTEAAKQPTVSYHPLTCPLTNVACKRLEHHHLFQEGEDHQYAAIDPSLPMADVVSADLPATETRKTK
ncbi:uncharacterized protein TNCV_1413741 [Trichonephila clavipes]|nr:uncharacterized protein TNCV_1413741 [Trichonephila clavipes]